MRRPPVLLDHHTPSSGLQQSHISSLSDPFVFRTCSSFGDLFQEVSKEWAQWSKRQGVVELFPGLSSPNRTGASQRMRLSIQQWLMAITTSP